MSALTALMDMCLGCENCYQAVPSAVSEAVEMSERIAALEAERDAAMARVAEAEADRDVAESRKSQAFRDLHDRAEKAEARVAALESVIAELEAEDLRLVGLVEEACDETRRVEAERDKAEARVAELEEALEEAAALSMLGDPGVPR